MATIPGSQRLLDISGNNISTAVSLEASGTILDVNGAAGVSGQVLSSTGSAVDWVTPTNGTVTSVNNGNGMNFTNITSTGTVTLGTPSTITATTTNSVSASSHTHAITGFATGTGSASGTNTGDNPGVTSVGISHAGDAFTTSAAITTTGTLAITMAGTAAQYINGQGNLITFPSSSATNLAYTTAATTGVVTSSTGTNATLPAATTTLAGLLTGADKTKLDGIATGAQANVATNLTKTTSVTDVTINSSTGSNIAIGAATTSVAGVMTKALYDNVIANNAKVSNVTSNLGYTASTTNGVVTSSDGTNATLPLVVSNGNAGLMTGTDKLKLDGIAAGAQVNVATNLGITAGTTAGPIVTSSTGTNATLPTASASASGVVTTGAQTWAGAKTFTSDINISKSGLPTIVFNDTTEVTTAHIRYNGIDDYFDITADTFVTGSGTFTANVAALNLSGTNTGDNPGVTSVGITHAGNAFTVGSAVTTTGTLDITMAGATTQYINGQGNLITFPSIPQGDITGVTAGTGLTGGGTSGTVTLNVAGGTYTPYNDIRSLGVPSFTNGTDPNITTAQVMAEIEGDGGFDSYSSVFKTSWSYAGNYNLTDAGDFTETAGSSWITWTDNSDDTTRGNVTTLAIAPNSGGSAWGVFIYNDQGAGYSPGWREVWTSMTDGAGSGLDADLLDGQQGAYYYPASNPANFTGTQTTVSGNAGSATVLQTARTIAGVSFNGSANISLNNNAITNGAGYITSYVNTTYSAGSGLSLTGTVFANTAPNIVQTTVSGNAGTATALQTARTINGVSFNGSANITVEPYVEDAVSTSVTRYITFVDNSTAGYKRLNEDANLAYNPGTNVLTVPTVAASLSGNATTATTLQNARLINGVSFNGSANITVADSTKLPLTGGTLTGGLDMGSAGTYSRELKFVNNTWIAGIDYQNNGKLRLIDRSGGRESINFYVLNGDIEARNTSNVITNILSTSNNSYFNSPGNFGIGTTNPLAKLDVNGTIRVTSSGDRVFLADATNGTFQLGDLDLVGDEANIAGDGSTIKINTNGSTTLTCSVTGRVGIGVTSPTAKLSVVAPYTSSGTIADFKASTGSAYGMTILKVETPNYGNGIAITRLSGGLSNDGAATFYYGTALVGSIRINTTSTSYVTSSDYRLKEDLKDFNGLEMILNIPVYDHKWTVDDSRSYSVLAHELQEVLPQAVSGEKDGEEMQGVDYSKIVPLLIKSIQEQQSMIEKLNQRILTLENK